MRWFRSNIRNGARLALFALGIQLALTFGHVHLNGIRLGASQATSIVAGNTASPASDPNHKPQGTPDYDCPICALIQLASASVPSAAPVLPVPAVSIVLQQARAPQMRLMSSPHLSFQARAPPSI